MKAFSSRFRFVGTFALFLTLPFLTGADGNGCGGGSRPRRHPAPMQQRAAHPRTARASRRHPTRSSVRAGLRSAEPSAPRAPPASVNGTSRVPRRRRRRGFVRLPGAGAERSHLHLPRWVDGRPRVRDGTGRHLRMADSIVLDAGVSRAGLLPELSERDPQGQPRLRYVPVRPGRCGRRRVDLHHRRGLREREASAASRSPTHVRRPGPASSPRSSFAMRPRPDARATDRRSTSSATVCRAGMHRRRCSIRARARTPAQRSLRSTVAPAARPAGICIRAPIPTGAPDPRVTIRSSVVRRH